LTNFFTVQKKDLSVTDSLQNRHNWLLPWITKLQIFSKYDYDHGHR